MKRKNQILLSIVFTLLCGFSLTRGETIQNKTFTSLSNSDYKMGEFVAVRKDDGCVKMTITVYEIAGSEGSYYALIDGEKYKVSSASYHKTWGYELWEVVDCERPSINGNSNYNRYKFAITYKQDLWVFSMPVSLAH